VINDFAGPLQSAVNSGFFEQAFIKMSIIREGKKILAS
jgi:hypothetical protein